MNCFELISSVLEEEYSQIPGSEEERDRTISSALKHLSEHYGDVSNNGAGNYCDRAARFAYIFCYTTSHANLVYQIINTLPCLKDIFDEAEVEVSCIGGGPGSDYLGIIKYLMMNSKTPTLRCNLFDREPAWMESWSDVGRKVQSELRLSVRSITFDVTKPDSWQPHTKYYRSDLFTFIYFLSEVVKLKDSANPYFERLMQQARVGATFLFIDNRSSDHFGWFDELASSQGLVTLYANSGRLNMPYDEQKSSLGRFAEKFKKDGGRNHWFPKLNADVAIRVVEKQ